MGAQDIRAGRAYVEVGAQDKFTGALNKIAAKFTSIGTVVAKAGAGLTAIGLSILAPISAAAKVFADMGSEIYDASKRTGVAAEQLSALAYAADQSGSNLGEVEAGLRKMSKTLAGADDESKKSIKTLSVLGIKFDDLKGLTPDKQFEILGDRISKISDPAHRATAAMELFGKSGTQLLPIFEDGAASLEAMEKRAESLGLTITGDAAKRADAFGDILNDLWKQAKAVTFWVGSAVADALQPYAEATTRILKSTIDWVKENKGLIVTIAAVALGLVAAGGALTTLGLSFIAIGAVLSGVATGIGVVGTVLAAIVSPIGLVATALVGLAAYFLFATETGGKALAWLADRFNDLKSDAMTAFKGISDALAAGEIRLAAQVLWAGIKLEWTRGIGFLSIAWSNFKAFFLKESNNIFAGAMAAWEIVQNGLQTAWINTAAFFSRIFTTAIAAVQKVWEQSQNAIAKGWVDVMGFFDSSLDTEAVKSELDKQSQANVQNIEAEKNASLAAVDETQKARLASAKQQHDTALAGISAQNKAENDAINQQTQTSEKAAAAELDAAKAELKKLADQAAAAKAAATGAPALPDKPNLPDLGDMAAKLDKAVSARGTFNAAAIQSLQTDATQERIAKGVEESARTLRQIKAGQPAFT